jgi:hypothetical protein
VTKGVAAVAAPAPDMPKPVSNEATTSSAARPTVTVTIFANIRVSGEAGAPIVRVANPGERFAVFGSAYGWVQVGPIGSDKPMGWIWASVTNQD